MIQERTTKYTQAVRVYLEKAGHASNAQILLYLQQQYPQLSATTVHRITTRMTERGDLNPAPVTHDNAVRFDANTAPHDHFQCTRCDQLRDVVLPQTMFQSIQDMMGDCKLTGRLTIQGSCETCLGHKEEV